MSNSENVDCRDSFFDVAMLEAEFRKDKAKGKSNFTRSLNNLFLIAASKNLSSRIEVSDTCQHGFMQGICDGTSYQISRVFI